MDYVIVKDGRIENVIVAEANIANELGAFPAYEGARIGDIYDPPTLEKLKALDFVLQSDMADTDLLLVDQEYRLTLLELGVKE